MCIQAIFHQICRTSLNSFKQLTLFKLNYSSFLSAFSLIKECIIAFESMMSSCKMNLCQESDSLSKLKSRSLLAHDAEFANNRSATFDKFGNAFRLESQYSATPSCIAASPPFLFDVSSLFINKLICQLFIFPAMYG